MIPASSNVYHYAIKQMVLFSGCCGLLLCSKIRADNVSMKMTANSFVQEFIIDIGYLLKTRGPGNYG